MAIGPEVRVLLLEHNDSTADAIEAVLGAHEYEVARRRAMSDALTSAKTADLVLLNLELPEVDGLSLLAELRSASSAAVLVYSVRSDVNSVVAALQHGADDYMVEPVRLPELVARIRAIGRRTGIRVPEEIVRVGDIKVCFGARVAEIDGAPVHLTPKQFEIVAILARNAGKAVGREEILRGVWGRVDMSASKNLDVHMAAIRSKLARPNLLLTVRGFGYRLAASS